MRDNLTTIPLSEIFEKQDGCPVCRLRDTVEARVVEFVTGAAMMEPDVRQRTNEEGFCATHFAQLLAQQKRLPVALVLESHLARLDERLFGKGALPFSRPAPAKKYPLAGEVASSCFVCDRTQWALERLLDTLARTYAAERDFRALFDAQPMLCLPHYYALLATGEKALGKKEFAQYADAAAAVCRAGLTALREDVAWFCRKHDYQNRDADWGNARDAIERAGRFLTSRG